MPRTLNNPVVRVSAQVQVCHTTLYPELFLLRSKRAIFIPPSSPSSSSETERTRRRFRSRNYSHYAFVPESGVQVSNRSNLAVGQAE